MKAILKKLLPPAVIGSLANTFNKLNRSIVAPFVFNRYPEEKINFLHRKRACPVDFAYPGGPPYQALPRKVSEAFIEFNDVKQEEFVAMVEDCLIEPRYGWPVTSRRELIYQCFPNSHVGIVPLPSPYLNTASAKEFNKIISFRDIFEFGHWHFFTDIIHKNHLLRTIPEIDEEIPILVSKAVSMKPAFKLFYDQTDIFKGRKIIIQEGIVRASQAFFIKPMPNFPAYYKATSEMAWRSKGDYDLNRKIFLARAEIRGRYIINMTEVADVVRRYGFDIVDADELPIEGQIRLFSETEFLIGIHGAGLTNMMFRHPHRMKVLEILPLASGRYQIPPHYFLLSGAFKFSYMCILGGPYINKLKKSFRVDTVILESSIRHLLENQ